eukprot:TRINITY_DN36608_c0_g1_i4.p1 TRINITY_DN36608_c0_g1~~TRINITY_DN36608_c0_g1_i4.p1  ORF type:complete len:577 (-),score=73.54 TRINITY_DN36608_c0_g1_i4:97-1827(-)
MSQETQPNDKEKVQPADSLLGLLPLGIAALAAVRLTAAYKTMIADCDETFNYWEPMHFLAFGRGFQTWEYSPQYALRSYMFLLPYAAVAYSAESVLGRPAAFFVTRAFQACAATLAEAAFVAAVRKRFGQATAVTTVLLLAASPGNWAASVALLPSSVAMLLVCLVWALWLLNRFELAIFFGLGTVIVVYPFTGLLFVPLGFHALFAKGPVKALLAALMSGMFWCMASLFIDSYFYGRTVLPAAELLRYNVFSKGEGRGPDIYGVEPWHFYLVNGALNLNLALPGALGLPVVAMLATVASQKGRWSPLAGPRPVLQCLGFAGSGIVWLAFFSCIPHKEERFLAPAYPLLVLAAAASLHGLVGILQAAGESLGPKVAATVRPCTAAARPLFIIAALLLSVARIAAVQTGYSAPLSVYRALSEELQLARSRLSPTEAVTRPLHVCIGAEWYRFTTSFFLPHSQDHLSYVRFGPTGLLPAEWNVTLGTRGIPLHMNDQNKEEPSRYIDRAVCSYFIDVDLGGIEVDAAAIRQEAWEVVFEAPFLDAGRSRQPWRSFYLPGLSAKKNAYASYRLLRRPSD